MTMTISRAAMDALQQAASDIVCHANRKEIRAILDRCTVVESGTIKNSVLVDRGALCMALNVLRRADKTEIADALESACSTPPAAESAEAQCPFCHSPKHGLVLEPCPALNDPKTFDLVPALREVTDAPIAVIQRRECYSSIIKTLARLAQIPDDDKGMISRERAMLEVVRIREAIDKMNEAERAALESFRARLSTAQGMPGWKLVPTTATPDMVGAGSKAARHSDIDGYRLLAIYRAMIAAAPEAP